MEQFNIKSLKNEARSRIAPVSRDARTLVLIYFGVLAALTLASGGLQLYLDSQISGTGGLSGLGLRSMLQTIQTVLSYVNMFFGPFWQAGFLFCIINILRGVQTGPKDLTTGFRRFGRVLAYTVNSALITLILSVLSLYAASILFSMSPWGTSFAEAMGPALTDPNLFTADGAVNLDLIPMEALMIAMPSMVVMFAVVFLPLQTYINYGLRMAQYLLMEGGLMSGMGAMVLSWRMTKGHRMTFLKLDLSYWWYYALLFAAALVGYLDVLLSLAGIKVPIDPTLLYFMTMGAYLVVELVIGLWKKCEVDAASVLIYESILHPVKASESTAISPADPA